MLDQETGEEAGCLPEDNGTTVLAGRTILVVDDDQDVRDLFKLNLEKLGCRAISARNGNEAISLFRQSLQSDTPIDAIILDLNLSTGMDGGWNGAR